MVQKKLKSSLLISLVLILALSLAIITVVYFKAESMVVDFLDRKLPHHVQLEYESIDVNVFTGDVELKDITVQLLNRDSMLVHTKVEMEALALNGLSYWQFFVKKNIDVDRLNLERPIVEHYQSKVLPQQDKERQGVVQLLKTIEIEALNVVDGQLTLFQKEEDSMALEAKKINFSLMNAKTGPEQIKERIPITYGHYRFATENVFVDLGPYEQLQVGTIILDDGDAKVKDLNLRSKFSKAELSRKIRTERDHIVLNIPETTLDSIHVGFKNDTLSVSTGPGLITKPVAEIFRDKLTDDDMTHKKLYSKMLRELPIYIKVPKVAISGGRLLYSERIEANVAPGQISFDDLTAVLLNISNRPENVTKTTVAAEANLMDHAPISLDWSFDVSKINDAFTASGVIHDFKTGSINAFLESNLRARAKGTINRMYFTVSGDAISSSGDMKMKYEDFEFSVLKKNRLGVNKLLTAIGNLFVNDGSNSDVDGFRYGSIAVERDPTKSFFNYLWLNVKEGTINTMIGKSEKK